MKVVPISKFDNRVKNHISSAFNASFMPISVGGGEKDSFIKSSNETLNLSQKDEPIKHNLDSQNPSFCKKNSLSRKDAQFILESGEVFLKNYKSAKTTEEKDEALKTYRKNVRETLDSRTEYSALRHYWGNRFNLGEFAKYQILKLENALEEEREKLVENLVASTAEIINFDQSLKNNSNITSYEILKQIIKNEKETLKQRNINIEIQNEDLLKKEGDNTWIYENFVIMSNLIQNAIKYSPDDSTIKIDIQEREVVEKGMIPKFDKTRNVLFFIIEDEGIGIPKENQESIFDNGYRGNNVGTIQGTGQGLNDVKNNVLAGRNKYIKIISPLKPDEPIYKGTRICCPLNIE